MKNFESVLCCHVTEINNKLNWNKNKLNKIKCLIIKQIIIIIYATNS